MQSEQGRVIRVPWEAGPCNSFNISRLHSVFYERHEKLAGCPLARRSGPPPLHRLLKREKK
jgi:hypothetical protein